MEKTISNILNYYYELVKDYCDDKHYFPFGVFLYGSHNYGLADETSDFDAYAFVVPDFYIIAQDKKLLSKELVTEYGIINLKDIRSLGSLLVKSNPNIIEILFNQNNCIFNDYYKSFKDIFFNKKDTFANLDFNRFLASVRGMMISTAKSAINKENETYNPKKLYQFFRLGYIYKSSLNNLEIDTKGLTPLFGADKKLDYVYQAKKNQLSFYSALCNYNYYITLLETSKTTEEHFKKVTTINLRGIEELYNLIATILLY